jgi:hypothetical protein
LHPGTNPFSSKSSDSSPRAGAPAAAFNHYRPAAQHVAVPWQWQREGELIEAVQVKSSVTLVRIDAMHLVPSTGCAVLKRLKKMDAPKIISCTIGPYPKSLREPMPFVTATFEDGTIKKLFWFYPDELSFSKEELIGLTEAEARRLQLEKDRAY